MDRSWTPEQVAALAPDPASLKAGQGLSSPRKWNLLGRDAGFVWGLAQGSGAQPYQVQVDLDEPAFKCSCPSRKFPCKHGIGLLLVLAAQPAAIAAAARPPWVDEWVAKRQERAAKAEAKAQAPAATPDPEAQAKRREKRTANISKGVELLDGWLRDLARQGLATLPAAGYRVWDETARRLVDAQAPGLARQIRELGSLAAATAHPEREVLAELGRLHLLTAAWTRRESLSPEWQAELQQQVGWSTDLDELRAQPGRRQRWFAAAQSATEENNLITRTTCLFGEDGAVAQVLEFSHAAQAVASPMAAGRAFDGEVVFFPGLGGERALVKTPLQDAPPFAPRPLDDVAALLDRHATRLATNPLLEDSAVLVALTPRRSVRHWELADAGGAAVPIAGGFARGWELLAASGGSPVTLCGRWNGFHFHPLSLLPGDGVVSLT